jgi:hypothetical protein
MRVINARNMEQSKHCVLFQGTTQNLCMSMKEEPKISFVIVAEEVTIKHGIFQNRIQNVSFTPTCSKGRGGPCVECSEGILAYRHVMSVTESDGFKVDSAPAIVTYNLSPQEQHFASLLC